MPPYEGFEGEKGKGVSLKKWGRKETFKSFSTCRGGELCID
jgi:hypothetical protein